MNNHAHRPLPTLADRCVGAAAVFMLCTLWHPAQAAEPAPAVIADAVRLAVQAASAQAPKGARVEARAGSLDPRLVLAPCTRVDAYLVAGVPVWGATRVGLRCVDGAVRWNVFLPVAVQVWSPAVVATVPLPAGTVLEPGQLVLAEADWGAPGGPPSVDREALTGRALARPVVAGQPLRTADLRQRQWFAAGETVRIVAAGSGYAVSAEGQAVSNGLEGQPVRVRTEGGRVLLGRAVGTRQVEVGP